MSSIGKQAVRSLYRELITYAQLLENAPQKQQSLNDIRTSFRSHAKETNTERIEQLYQEGQKRLAFLKTITPRLPGTRAKMQPREHFVVRNGELMEDRAQQKKLRGFNDMRLDPEDFERHKRLLDRQHFGGPYWQKKNK